MEPKSFTKKPVKIQAVQFTPELTPGEAHAIYKWIEDNTLGSFDVNELLDRFGDKDVTYPESGVSLDARDGRIVISTLEGLHWVDMNDWIIRGVKGEFYPCKPDIFSMSYDEDE